jgi:hypothetical protein
VIFELDAANMNTLRFMKFLSVWIHPRSKRLAWFASRSGQNRNYHQCYVKYLPTILASIFVLWTQEIWSLQALVCYEISVALLPTNRVILMSRFWISGFLGCHHGMTEGLSRIRNLVSTLAGA